MNSIEKTKHYEMFTHGEIQRKTHTVHINKLKRSMKTYGFLESKPITVFEDGERLVIIDGHHRLAAAKELGIPVVYLIVKKSENASMMIQNAIVMRWSFADYCKAWADKGNENYIDLIADSEHIPIKFAASLLAGQGAGTGNVASRIQDGTFKIKTRRVVDLVLSLIDKFGETNKAISSRAFIAAFSKCMLVDEFAPDQLKRRIAANPLGLIKTANEAQMLDQLEEIYNRKSAVKIPLAYMAREASASRNPKRDSKSVRDDSFTPKYSKTR